MEKNNQLIEHCREILAETENHEQWAVDMARVALASLEAEPVAWMTNRERDPTWPRLHKTESDADKCVAYVELRPLLTKHALYPAPPAPKLKKIDLSGCKKVWYEHDDLSHEIVCIPVKEIKRAIRAAGYEVKS